jgi:hypothetical protein
MSTCSGKLSADRLERGDYVPRSEDASRFSRLYRRSLHDLYKDEAQITVDSVGVVEAHFVPTW